jgi:MSHA biogenesis protein MshG
MALAAGVPIRRALRLLGEEGGSIAIRRASRRLLALIESGATFGQAVHWERRAFPAFFVQMVMVGEQSGRLEQVLQNLAKRADDAAETYNRLTQQISYPLALIATIIVGIPAFVTLMSVVVAGGGLDTAILSALRIMVRNSVPLLILCLIVYFLWRLVPLGRWAAWLPFAGRRSMRHRFTISRFAGALAAMLDAGLAIRSAIPLAADAAGPVFAAGLRSAPCKLEAGDTLANVFRQSALFDEETLGAVETGEMSGRLCESLYQVDRLSYAAALYRLRNCIVLVEGLFILAIGLRYIFSFSRGLVSF